MFHVRVQGFANSICTPKNKKLIDLVDTFCSCASTCTYQLSKDISRECVQLHAQIISENVLVFPRKPDCEVNSAFSPYVVCSGQKHGCLQSSDRRCLKRMEMSRGRNGLVTCKFNQIMSFDVFFIAFFTMKVRGTYVVIKQSRRCGHQKQNFGSGQGNETLVVFLSLLCLYFMKQFIKKRNNV